MKSYRTNSVVTESKEVILSDMPFSVGDKVDVVVSRSTNGSKADRVRKLKDLFNETQSLPQIRTLTEDEILLEVEAHRSNK